FGTDQFRPGTTAGDALLAHELSHVVQQGSSEAVPGARIPLGQPSDALEHEADQGALTALEALHGQKDKASAKRDLRGAAGLQLRRCDSDKKTALKPRQPDEARADAQQVLAFIRTEAKTRAAQPQERIKKESKFYKRLTEMYLPDYLAAPSATTG